MPQPHRTVEITDYGLAAIRTRGDTRDSHGRFREPAQLFAASNIPQAHAVLPALPVAGKGKPAIGRESKIADTPRLAWVRLTRRIELPECVAGFQVAENDRAIGTPGQGPAAVTGERQSI